MKNPLHQTHTLLMIASVMLAMVACPQVMASEILPPTERTNGSSTLKALEPLRGQIQKSQITVGRNKKESQSATVVGVDGYLLTKASEAERFKPWKAFLEDGSEMDVRLVHRDHDLDLVLLKVEQKGFTEVAWPKTEPLKIGQWLCSLEGEKNEMRMGVVSAKSRAIENSGVVLGLRMGPDDEDEGVLIEEVAYDSPAEESGLKAEDLVMTVDGNKVLLNKDLNQIVMAKNAGDTVQLTYLRQGTPGQCEVRLTSKSRIMMNWSGEDFANGGTSLRTDNFPSVIQHEIPLSPQDMGSAVYDLRGKAVGINIARVNRVTTYALPTEVFVDKLHQWIQEDREAALTQGQ